VERQTRPAAARPYLGAMDRIVLAVFAAAYLGMLLGGLPGLALDRAGVPVAVRCGPPDGPTQAP